MEAPESLTSTSTTMSTPSALSAGTNHCGTRLRPPGTGPTQGSPAAPAEGASTGPSAGRGRVS